MKNLVKNCMVAVLFLSFTKAFADAKSSPTLAPRSLTTCFVVLGALQDVPARNTAFLTSVNDLKRRVDEVFRQVVETSNRSLVISLAKDVHMAQLISPVDYENTRIIEVERAQMRLQLLSENLIDRPNGVIVVAREIRGAEAITDFVENLRAEQLHMGEEVDRQMEAFGIDLERPLQRELKGSILGPLAATILTTALGAASVFGYDYSTSVGLALGGVTAASAFSAYSIFKDNFILGLKNALGGEHRERARVEIENRLAYRARALDEFLSRVTAGVASGRLQATDFAYHGETHNISPEFYQELTGTSEASIDALARVEGNRLNGTSRDYPLNSPQMAVDFIASVDPDSGEPALTVIVRVSNERFKHKIGGGGGRRGIQKEEEEEASWLPQFPGLAPELEPIPIPIPTSNAPHRHR